MFVIVEIDESMHLAGVEVVGPFEVGVKAESERRRRYFDRAQDNPHNTARWFKSYVREVVQS